MAINTTGNNGSVVGVIGVHPDNIGKGILWDENTKTYYVAIDDKIFERDELGRLKLRVSALEDNQLKLRDDGSKSGYFTGFADCKDLVGLYGCILTEKTKAVRIGNGARLYRDDATKSVFGMSLNWDIFANP